MAGTAPRRPGGDCPDGRPPRARQSLARPSPKNAAMAAASGSSVIDAGRAERRVPELALPWRPRPDIGVRLVVPAVAGGDPVVDLVLGDRDVEVLGPEHRHLVGHRPAQRRVAGGEPRGQIGRGRRRRRRAPRPPARRNGRHRRRARRRRCRPLPPARPACCRAAPAAARRRPARPPRPAAQVPWWWRSRRAPRAAGWCRCGDTAAPPTGVPPRRARHGGSPRDGVRSRAKATGDTRSSGPNAPQPAVVNPGGANASPRSVRL